MYILFLLLSSLYLILNQQIIQNNYKKIYFGRGISKYTYHISKINHQSEKIAYFFFRFSECEKIKFKIIINDENEIFLPIYLLEWIYFPLDFDDKEKDNFNITFVINSTYAYYYYERMIFMSNFGEINISLEDFLNLNFDIEFLYKPPFPLIFNLDIIKESTTISFNQTNFNKIYDGNYIFNYCIEEENKCNYIGSNNLNITFLKDKKYKIKINCYSNKSDLDLYYFKSIDFFQDIHLGKQIFSINKSFKPKYYILNIKNYENIYIFCK